MRIRRAFLALLLAACGGTGIPPGNPAGAADGEAFVHFPPDTPPEKLVAAVEEGLATPGKGADFTRFVLIADGGRYGSSWQPANFHVVVGGGGAQASGSLTIRRRWNQAGGGMVDGRNDLLQTMGVSVAIERGASRPYAPEVLKAVSAFCAALAGKVPLHPDCVLAMGDVPYVREHPAAPDERRAAEEARKGVPVPRPDGIIVVGGIAVEVERRDTPNAIATGMMMRRRFDGENRGMLFVYAHSDYRWYHMQNCFLPIDLAYIREGKVDQILAMEPQAGVAPENIRRYQSESAVRHVLEMPSGWFRKNGIEVGTVVSGLP